MNKKKPPCPECGYRKYVRQLNKENFTAGKIGSTVGMAAGFLGIEEGVKTGIGLGLLTGGPIGGAAGGIMGAVAGGVIGAFLGETASDLIGGEQSIQYECSKCGLVFDRDE